MQKPESNLPLNAAPWGRWMEGVNNEQAADIQQLKTAIDALSRGDGSQANQFASLTVLINRLFFEMEHIYGKVGEAYPPSAVAPPPPAVPTYDTIDVGPSWSRTWGSSSYYTGGGEYTNGSYLYQGSNPEDKVGLVRFDIGGARGKTITAASLFLQNIDSAWSNPFTARLGTHGFVSAPTAKPGRSNAFDVGWSRGEGKWHPLPTWTYAGLSNGTIQGFTTGASGASDADSAWFQGAGMPQQPVLRITYATS